MQRKQSFLAFYYYSSPQKASLFGQKLVCKIAIYNVIPAKYKKTVHFEWHNSHVCAVAYSGHFCFGGDLTKPSITIATIANILFYVVRRSAVYVQRPIARTRYEGRGHTVAAARLQLVLYAQPTADSVSSDIVQLNVKEDSPFRRSMFSLTLYDWLCEHKTR